MLQTIINVLWFVETIFIVWLFYDAWQEETAYDYDAWQNSWFKEEHGANKNIKEIPKKRGRPAGSKNKPKDFGLSKEDVRAFEKTIKAQKTAQPTSKKRPTADRAGR